MRPFPLLACALLCAAPFLRAEKAPYRVLYSNDTTHILSCPSPYKPFPGPFDDLYLRASVDEAKGADAVQMLQAGLGWQPWWKSEQFPIAEHINFLREIGRRPNAFEDYLAQGGDLVAVFIDECKKIGRPAFVSVRMNDVHHTARARKAKTPEERERLLAEIRLLADNPDARIGRSDTSKMDQKPDAPDWGKEVIREQKFDLIKELCDNYDIDGLELDFMRQWVLFNPDRVSKEERIAIVTDFVKRIRAALDAKGGKRRWLCVRIPAYLDSCMESGFDPKALAEAGVDMFNMSTHYNTDFQIPIREFRELVGPEKAIYGETHFAGAIGPRSPSGTVYLKRTPPVQFYTFANLLYARGGDGVSFFNFPYYRGTHSPSDVPGDPDEPPFEVLEKIGDREWIANRMGQQYALGALRREPIHEGRPLQRPQTIGEPETIVLDMAPPRSGWQTNAKLRIQGRSSLARTAFTVRFNGRMLSPISNVSDPFASPYTVAEGEPEDYKAYIVPNALLRDGKNTIQILQTKGDPAHIFYIDLSVNAPRN